MAKSIWAGSLALGLVNIALKAYKATDDPSSETATRQLHGACNTPVNQKRVCPTCDVEVPFDQLVKGVEIADGKFVILTDEDVKAIRAESSETIAIERTVPIGAVDSLYIDSTYYLAPDGKGAAASFVMLREALAQKGKMAIGHLAIYGREHLVGIRPIGQLLAMQMLRSHDEVRNIEEVPGLTLVPSTVDKAQVALAGQLLDMYAGDFDPTAHEDSYVVAFKALVEAKTNGTAAPAAASKPMAQVVDIMEALKASLATGKNVKAKAPKAKMAKASDKVKAKKAS